MKIFALTVFAFFGMLTCSVVKADWHVGTVSSIYYSYDGLWTTFTLNGLTKSNCTCYAGWASNLCLNRARATFKEEAAALLTASFTNRRLSVNIDEVSCVVIAFGVPVEQ